MSLVAGSLFEKGINKVSKVFAPRFEVGRFYELKSDAAGDNPKHVKLLEVYDDSILSVPEDLNNIVVYGELDQNGEVVKKINCPKDDFDKLFIKLPKGIEIIDDTKADEPYKA